MKKLFTLLALLTCFMGAKAIEIVDAEVDFSKYNDISEFQFAGWGASESAKARLSIKDGCLHFDSQEATEPSWDCQFHPIGGVDAEVDVTYTLHFKIKGSVAQNVSMLGFGQTPYGQFPITTEWVEGTVDYVCTDAAGGNLLMQCGDYVGSWDIAYLKITHEGKEQKPVQWQNFLVNGDAEGEYGDPACAFAKVYDPLAETQPDPTPAVIEAEADGNKVFAVHTVPVDPPLVWDSDGEQWGTQHKAGDPKPDNAWQNQFWVNLPKTVKEGTPLKMTFKYKASKAASADLQTHTTPGAYLGGFTPGSLNFGTDWTEFSQEFTAPSNDFQSLAFNLGVGEQYKDDIVFYFDDLTVSTMVLDEGYFVASMNTETGLVEYDLDNATQFVYDEVEDAYVATVGTKGDKDSWVNQVMISTVRGNDKAFKGATIKVSGSIPNGEYVAYVDGSNGKIDLPAAGVWTIAIAPEDGLIKFTQVEGEEIIVIEIVPNPAELTVNATERKYTDAEAAAILEETGETVEGGGAAWDNQFWIAANRSLSAGEETVIEFDYVATKEAKTTTQCHKEGDDGKPCTYLHYSAIGDVTFTTEVQHFSKTFKIDAAADGMKSIAFNLSEIKEANDYTIKNVVWKLANGKETLIDMEGTKNFWVKVNSGAPYLYGTTPDVPVTKGDANGDGTVDVADVVAIVNKILGEPAEGFNEAAADVNGDGTIDVADVVATVNIILGE